jgi:hypothetical protein
MAMTEFTSSAVAPKKCIGQLGLENRRQQSKTLKTKGVSSPAGPPAERTNPSRILQNSSKQAGRTAEAMSLQVDQSCVDSIPRITLQHLHEDARNPLEKFESFSKARKLLEKCQ